MLDKDKKILAELLGVCFGFTDELYTDGDDLVFDETTIGSGYDSSDIDFEKAVKDIKKATRKDAEIKERFKLWNPDASYDEIKLNLDKYVASLDRPYGSTSTYKYPLEKVVKKFKEYNNQQAAYEAVSQNIRDHYHERPFANLPSQDKVDKLFGVKSTISGPYSDMAELLGMTSGPKEVDGVRSLFSKGAMSYGNGFKFGDEFKNVPAGEKRRVQGLLPALDIKAVKRSVTYPELLLIFSPGYNFLQTEDALNR